MTLINKAPLKWPGAKSRISNTICEVLPKRPEVLVEPFVGGASLFLNSNYKQYILNDINSDLISFYKYLQKRPEEVILEAKKLFSPNHNTPDVYYKLRTDFNAETDPKRRSVLFLYLNRHGFNGLVRYNKSNQYNVPVGAYKKPYFPEKELYLFSDKAQSATFTNRDFESAMLNAPFGANIYCDPPYVPFPNSKGFTNYSGSEFTWEQQCQLARLADSLSTSGFNTVLISNHNTKTTRDIYKSAVKKRLSVSRSISCKGYSRKPAKELLALFKMKN